MKRLYLVVTLVALLGPVAAASAQEGGSVLSTTRPGGTGFAPAFIGNGYLAGRQPAAGQGFDEVPLAGSDEPLATQSQVQGLYAKTTKKDEGRIERRAALPAWSTLGYETAAAATRWSAVAYATTARRSTCARAR